MVATLGNTTKQGEPFVAEPLFRPLQSPTQHTDGRTANIAKFYPLEFRSLSSTGLSSGA
jgi:hypothetical protein